MADFEALKLLQTPEIKDSENQTNLLLGLMKIIGGPEGSRIAAASHRPGIRRHLVPPAPHNVSRVPNKTDGTLSTHPWNVLNVYARVPASSKLVRTRTDVRANI